MGVPIGSARARCSMWYHASWHKLGVMGMQKQVRIIAQTGSPPHGSTVHTSATQRDNIVPGVVRAVSMSAST